MKHEHECPRCRKSEVCTAGKDSFGAAKCVHPNEPEICADCASIVADRPGFRL